MAEVLGIGARIIGARLRSQMQYRTSFVLQIIGSLGASFLDFITILIIFHHLPRFAGWSIWEIGFLYGTSGIAFKIADLLVGKVERLGGWIRSGEFDSFLMKPLGSLFQTVTADTDLKQVGGLVQAAAVLIFALRNLSVDWTPGKVALTVSMILSGVVIFSGVWIASNAVSFWLVDARELANSLTYGGNYFTQYPIHIFEGWLRRLLAFVVPLAFVNYLPAVHILGKPERLGLPAVLRFASPLAAVAVAAAASLVWKTGIRRYRSTGS